MVLAKEGGVALGVPDRDPVRFVMRAESCPSFVGPTCALRIGNHSVREVQLFAFHVVTARSRNLTTTGDRNINDGDQFSVKINGNRRSYSEKPAIVGFALAGWL
jgi:hypothetical protein